MRLRNMFLCDAAIINPDGTFSVLRGGIGSVNIPLQKTKDSTQKSVFRPVKLSLVATIELEITEMGRLHNLEVAILDADGKRILPDLRTHFQPAVSQKKGQHTVLLDVNIFFKNAGTYGFYVNVDGQELGYHPLYINMVDIGKG